MQGNQGENDEDSEGLAQRLWNYLIFLLREDLQSNPHNLIISPLIKATYAKTIKSLIGHLFIKEEQ